MALPEDSVSPGQFIFNYVKSQVQEQTRASELETLNACALNYVFMLCLGITSVLSFPRYAAPINSHSSSLPINHIIESIPVICFNHL